MASDLLSLKWNNHNSTFFHLLLKLCLKELHSDATIACQGKYFPAHKLVLSSCSKYFEEIFEKTQCKHPFIIINDLDPLEFEALMQYMYKGEVNVPQNRLPALIKAAEALNIKGLAIPDEIPDSSYGADFNRKRRKFSDYSPSSKRKKLALHKIEEAERNHLPFQVTPETETFLHSNEQDESEHKLNLVENSDMFSEQPRQIQIKSEPKEEVCVNEHKVTLDGSGEPSSDPEAYSCPGGDSAPPPPYVEPHPDPLQLPNSTPSLNPLQLPNSSIPPSDIGYSPPDNVQRRHSATNFDSLKKYYDGERRTFRCHYCSYLSFNRTHTINHMRRHTGEKPFTCSLCMKRFSLKHNLDRHIKLYKHNAAPTNKPLADGLPYPERLPLPEQ